MKNSAPQTPLPDDDDALLGCACAHCFGLMEGKDIRWLRTALLQLILAGVLLGIGYAVRQYEPGARVRSNYVYRWAFLVSLCMFVYVAGRVVNWGVFRVVSRLALVPVLSDAAFYCLAVDGIVQHLTWIIVAWVAYDQDFIGLQHQNSLEQLFLLLLLLSILAVIRKAFLRHVLRDRLRAQYEQLSLRIFKAKSVVYRLTMAAYGLPAPTLESLPKALQLIESEALHKRAKRSYAEFNKMLSLAHGQGFLVHPNPFKSDETFFEITSASELEKFAERLFRKFYCRQEGIADLNKVEILSVESSGVNVNRGSSGFHALSHLYNSVNKWWHKESSKKQSRPASPGTEQGTGDSFRAPRSYRKATQDIQPPVARFTFGDQSKQTPVTLDPPGTSASAGRPKLLTDPAMLPSPLVLSQGKADSAIVPGESKGMEGQDGELFVPPTPSAKDRTPLAPRADMQGVGHLSLMGSPTHIAAVGASKPPPPALLTVSNAETDAPNAALNRTPRARAGSEMMTPAIQQTSKHPQIPIDSLKAALTTNVEHIPYELDKSDSPDDRKLVLFNYFCDLVDINGDGFVTSKELTGGFSTMIKDWKSLKRSWSGHETVSKAYHISTGVVCIVIAFILWMLVFELSYKNVLLPLGTLAVASAYAIGGSVSLMFQALMFIVLYSPYEVGDRVVIEGVQSDSSMIVTDITVTTTTFELGSGKKVIMANQVLMSKNIVNFRRSTSVSVTVKFGVGYRTTREQLSQLQERLKAYVKRHSVDWKKSVSISIDEASLTGVAVISISVSHLKTWQDSSDVSNARSAFIQAALKYMMELGIEYVEPAKPWVEQPLSSFPSLAPPSCVPQTH